MEPLREVSDPRLELLHQLLSAATHDASTAMSCWTSGLITLSLDEVRELPLAEACGELNMSDDLLTMVVLSLEGEIGGEMILTFDDENARNLAATLLNREVDSSSEWTELEQSALTETGNILGCAYMNALTRLIGVELVPSPPYFVQDFGASVLEQALMVQAISTDTVLVCRTRFERDGEALNWNVFFIPCETLQKRMENALLSTS